MNSSVGDLVRLIRHKQAQILRLHAELDEARAALNEAGGLLPFDSLPTPKPGRPRKVAHGREREAGGNSVTWAAAVLAEAGRPLHVNEIIARIARRFNAPVQYSTLVGNLSRLVKSQRTFSRYGKNIFGLMEWRKEESEEGIDGDQN